MWLKLQRGRLLAISIFTVICLIAVLQFGKFTAAEAEHSDTSVVFDLTPNIKPFAQAQDINAAPPTNSNPLPKPSDGFGYQDKLVKIWDASTAQEAWNLLENSDLSEPVVSHLLDKIVATCQHAHKTYDGLPPSTSNAIAVNHDKAVDIFVAKYCGNSSVLVARIDAALAPGLADLKLRVLDSIKRGVEFVGKPSSKRWSDIEKLTVASKSSIEAATALINEGLREINPVMARNLAERLVPASEGNGALATWNDYLPPLLPGADRTLVFTIAAELNVCSRSQACGANRPLAMYECAFAGHRTCQPNEDLLSYRRRTTSPMLYQAAEQIAAAMQARRYR